MYTQDEKVFFVSIAFDQRVVANQRIIDLSTVESPACFFLTFDPNTQAISFLASCNEGTVTLEQASTLAGEIVTGSIDLNLWSFRQ